MKIASFEKAEWIDAWRDRRPMTRDLVLVSVWGCDGHRVKTAWYDGDDWCASFGTVLAWMPLPEAYDPVAADEEARCEVCCEPLTDPVTVTLYPMDKEAGYED